MRRFMLLLVVGVLPALAVAQSYSKSPMVVVGNEAPAPAPAAAPSAPTADALANFPEKAITRVGETSTPDNAAANTPAAPSKLWPRNTLEIFMPRCTALKIPFVAPCRCVITKLMSAMGHDEFLKKSEDGTIEQDSRLIGIRTECAASPQRKD